VTRNMAGRGAGDRRPDPCPIKRRFVTESRRRDGTPTRARGEGPASLPGLKWRRETTARPGDGERGQAPGRALWPGYFQARPHGNSARNRSLRGLPDQQGRTAEPIPPPRSARGRAEPGGHQAEPGRRSDANGAGPETPTGGNGPIQAPCSTGRQTAPSGMAECLVFGSHN